MNIFKLFKKLILALQLMKTSKSLKNPIIQQICNQHNKKIHLNICQTKFSSQRPEKKSHLHEHLQRLLTYLKQVLMRA